MSKPIPKHLLFHSVQYREYSNPDGLGYTYSAPQVLENVRVEPINQIQRSNNRDDIEGKMMLFIDRVNSSPYTRPLEKSKIIFNGKEYEVNKVDEYPDEIPNSFHHYEVTLV